ncbi:hypothetical protein QUF61_05240 [Candidatus Venteria ishoeyi]|uniref:hypothetical protein n=1 Tax=Candidatus Venteria ishoeyi TaxID=1899563 RepID=UPI0025A63AF1|nr:hypothetical protein [Candidatus Venteria ishoeyi]MDM8545875.1 hypothetical protein [Candidatus Venteria ishoeyi]
MTYLKISLIALLVSGLSVSLLPRQADAWIFGFFARGFFTTTARVAAGGVSRGVVRSGFRQLAKGGGKKILQRRSATLLSKAKTRRVHVHQGQARMQRLFGKKPYTVRNKQGRIISSATVKGDKLIFREAGKQTGFAQWEKNGLMLYRSDGQKLARLHNLDNRLLAYDRDEQYLGQFIKEQIEDQIINYFVDALGNRHDYMPVPQISSGQQLPESERIYGYADDGSISGYSSFKDGILYVYNAKGVELAHVVREADILVVYDLQGEKQGSFKQQADKILAYDANDQLVGYIVDQDGKVVFLARS